MLASTNSTYQYQVGASLPPNAPSYVVRQADQDFYEGLKAREFCYVLNSRQMGKSSLRVQTMQKLLAENIACATIDITLIGSDVSQDQWYYTLAKSLLNNFRIQFKLSTWWREHELLSPLGRFSEFIEQVLLTAITESIVIFIDEIDSVLSLPFPCDDFFAFIRACYNQRVDKPEYYRLTWALLGVATPSDLIEDRRRTPFNIGQAIELNGFQEHEIQPLVKGLVQRVNNPDAVLKEILAWTGGQPFLTQKLCKLILTSSFPIEISFESEFVQNFICSQVIENWEAFDHPEHLKTIRDRILRQDKNTDRLLGLYQQILRYTEVIADTSSEQLELRLSGLVVKQDNKLKVYNQIYKAIFNEKWVTESLANLRPYKEEIAVWIESNYQDESCLLSGQTLHDAEEWASNRRLSDDDYKFLHTSRKAERKASKLLAEAAHQARKRIRISRNLFYGSSLVATLAIFMGLYFKIEGFNAGREIVKLDSQALSIYNNTVSAESSQLESLVSAIEVGKKTKLLIKQNYFSQFNQNVSSLLLLQAIISNVQEQNRLDFNKNQHEVLSISFNSDGLLIATKPKDINIHEIQEKENVQLWMYGQKIAILPSKSRVKKLSFSPNEQKLATFATDGTIRLWNLSGKLLTKWNISDKSISVLKFSPDGQYLCVISKDGIAKMWNIASQEITQLPTHQGKIESISFSPDRQYIATAGEPNKIRLWNYSGKQLFQWNIDKTSVSIINFSPNGKLIAIGARDGKIKILNLLGQITEQWKSEQSRISNITFSSDGQSIVTVGSDGTVKVWSLLSRKLINQLKASEINFTGIALSHNLQQIATVDEANTVQVWQLNNSLQNLLEQLPIKQDSGLDSLDFSSDGQSIISTEDQNNLKIWNLTGNEISLGGNKGNILGITFSSYNNLIAAIGHDSKVNIWDRSGKHLVVNKQTINNEKITTKISGIGVVFGWDRVTRKLIVTQLIAGSPSEEILQVGDRILSADGNSTVNTSRDNALAYIRGEEGTIVTLQIYRPRKGYLTRKIKRESFPIPQHILKWPTFPNILSFSPDEKTLAIGTDEGIVQLWDVSKNDLKLNNKKLDNNQPNPVTSVNFSPDGKYLAVAKDNSTIQLWNVSDKTILDQWNSYQGLVTNVKFSPDSQSLGTIGGSRVKIWNLSRQKITQLIGHQGDVLSLSFSPSSKIIATAGADNTVRLWNFSGQQIGQFYSNVGFRDVSFSRNEKSITTIELDGTVKQWRIGQGLDELLSRGCDWLKDYLATHPEEREARKVCSDR
ncbi:AAA-like domain-containing protein [Nostoc sp. C117]|uniref:WD40 domain-containing protein n=1 Tax=Nostoc sp. C117 TaxID=3349875 RepID=UPI00370D9E1E